ncbi:MAG: PKD domain-containing protein [Chitinophagaceae bacterium]|nr:MAG: PKD domain-containing protein [Chitinophagaceae bacterium]
MDGGCQSTGCAPVMVQSVPQPTPVDSLCTAGFQVSMGNAPGERKFQAFTTPNRRATEICWYYGDGQQLCVAQPDPATQASLSAIHTYSNPGNYQVCVRIRYANGCVAQFCQNIFVTAPGNCTASFTDTALTERVHRFIGSGFVDAGDSIISYAWRFGDGTQAFGRNVTHTYFNGGTYQVCLETRTRNGCEARTCRTVTINAPNTALLTLVPNPVSTTLHANFLCSGGQGMATIRIITATGLIVRTETRPCYPGMNFWNFNVASLPTGFYTMNVQTGTQFVSAGFFKQ